MCEREKASLAEGIKKERESLYFVATEDLNVWTIYMHRTCCLPIISSIQFILESNKFSLSYLQILLACIHSAVGNKCSSFSTKDPKGPRPALSNVTLLREVSFWAERWRLSICLPFSKRLELKWCVHGSLLSYITLLIAHTGTGL